MTGQADRWIKRTTIGCVALLALIAGTVSYLHMHSLVALHGQPGRVAALTPLSVDGMIVAASTTLLADSRSGLKGGTLPWALLILALARHSFIWDGNQHRHYFEKIPEELLVASVPLARATKIPARFV